MATVTDDRRRLTARGRILAIVVAALVGAVAAILLAVLRHPAAAVPAGPAGIRTVLVVDSSKPPPGTEPVASRDCISRPTACENGKDGIEVVYSVGALAPEGRATVLTDTNCDPDANGISHCMNRLSYEDGSLATVRHDHSMGSDPCLAPGEQVEVERA